jgi:hypothetical protein
MDLFPELKHQDLLTRALSRHSRIEQVAVATHKHHSFPVLSFTMGSTDPQAPVFGLCGGIHGLERIGSQVVLAFMTGLAARLEWDETLRWQLERMRLVMLPLANPVGMYLFRRSNGNGVDLMRNSPARAAAGASPVVGGHRISRFLPWYMGDSSKMEVEARAVCDTFRRECFESRSAIVVDCHSGFGIRDQIWFPYARTREPFPHLAEVVALRELLEKAQPNHVYLFEPQAKNYTTHGDLWDWLYDEHRDEQKPGLFLPLTLEMGSWGWIKKNPFQLFTSLGVFNPIKPHRTKRILRRHLPLFDFLMRAVLSPQAWARPDAAKRAQLIDRAQELWYRTPGVAAAPDSSSSGRR